MDDQGLQRDSAGWRFYTRASFVCSVIATYWGIYFLPVDPWVRGYMAMGVLFVIGSSFTLAKAIRDDHEATRLINKISQAKTEKILKEYDVAA